MVLTRLQQMAPVAEVPDHAHRMKDRLYGQPKAPRTAHAKQTERYASESENSVLILSFPVSVRYEAYP